MQLFYIFIYSASISFLIFVYVFLLRKRSGEIIRQAVRRLSFHDSQPMFRRVVTFSNVGHSSGFYLRLGAIGNERFKAYLKLIVKMVQNLRTSSIWFYPYINFVIIHIIVVVLKCQLYLYHLFLPIKMKYRNRYQICYIL